LIFWYCQHSNCTEWNFGISSVGDCRSTSTSCRYRCFWCCSSHSVRLFSFEVLSCFLLKIETQVPRDKRWIFVNVCCFCFLFSLFLWCVHLFDVVIRTWLQRFLRIVLFFFEKSCSCVGNQNLRTSCILSISSKF
jgi:hypothetical protein